MLQAPTSLRALSLGFNQLLDFSNELLFPLASLTTTRTYVRQNSAIVKRIVKAHLDAVRFISANEDATLKILAKYTKINDAAFLREYHRKIILPRLSQTLAPDRAAIEFIWDVERKRNPAVAKVKAESFFDATFIDELRKEGY
jgi:ABC-type nitrate/sulfonate/bicarbonate transport system substrate-binding protein